MIPIVNLSSGWSMPMLGYGTWEVRSAQMFQTAFDLGYRHFDSATMYGNETTIGQVLSRFPRQEVFITSKLLPDSEMGQAATFACDSMLRKFQTDYLDLILIHWPGSDKQLRQETWRVMEKMVEAGKVKSIGVSNFLERHLADIEEVASITPAVNQIEYHPLCQNLTLLQYCADRHIVVEAYSPFGAGHRAILNNATLHQISQIHGKTIPQVILRWLFQLSIVSLPRSNHTSRMKENLSIFDFELTDQDMTTIAGLNEDFHTDWDPRSV